MKKDLFLSTKRKIILTSTSVVFLCLIIFTIIVSILYSSKIFDRIDMQINNEKHIFEKYISSNTYHENTELDHSNFEIKPSGKHMKIPPNLIVIIYNNGSLENMSNNLYFSEDNLPDLPDYSENNIITMNDNNYTFRAITLTKDEYRIEILGNVDSEMNSIHRLKNTIILSFIILLIISIFLSAFLASKVLKPVKKAYEKQTFFVQDASHEMRTPLAVIKGRLELLAQSFDDSIDMHFEHISKMMTEIRNLEKLNSNLLLLSKEDINTSNEITKFNLDDFINDISNFYMDLSEIKGINFNVIKPSYNLEVNWDYNRIKRSLIIILENAFKYTNENGDISLIFEDINKNIKVRVKDTGIGINKKDLPRIFDRFYRSEKVRGSNTSGNGIGLSLLKSICNNLGIKIKVISEPNIGSEFILIIPKNL